MWENTHRGRYSQLTTDLGFKASEMSLDTGLKTSDTAFQRAPSPKTNIRQKIVMPVLREIEKQICWLDLCCHLGEKLKMTGNKESELI